MLVFDEADALLKFDIPGPAERTEIWRILIPARVPVADDVDFRGIDYRFELTGGEIKNAILKALTECADKKFSKLPMSLLVKYAGEELEKNERRHLKISKIGFSNEKPELLGQNLGLKRFLNIRCKSCGGISGNF